MEQFQIGGYEDIDKRTKKSKKLNKLKKYLFLSSILAITFLIVIAIIKLINNSNVSQLHSDQLTYTFKQKEPEESPEKKKLLEKIMNPKSIAVVGASSKEKSTGSELMKRLTQYNFTGTIYPINSKGGIIEGIEAYKKIGDIPGEVDIAMIAVNSKYVIDTVDQCYEKGIRAIIIMSSGFKEIGEEGARMEKDLKEKIKKYDMRVIGPNVVGVINTHPTIKLDGIFAPDTLPRRGHIGFCSQSGSLGGSVLNILKDHNIGFSQFISIGNSLDVNAKHVLEYWEHVDDVKQILLYLESIPNAQKFRKLATRISMKKPILALKAGKSAAGATAISSHTGSLVGADKSAHALLTQSGIIREYTIKDLLLSAKVFEYSPIPKGDRVCIISNSGGAGIITTDAVVEHGMRLAKLSKKTEEGLKNILAQTASFHNPIDMISSSNVQDFKEAIQLVYNDPGVDMIIIIDLPVLEIKDEEFAKAIIEVKSRLTEKPIVCALMTRNDFFSQVLSKMDVNVPFYNYGEEAAKALGRLNEYRIWLNKGKRTYPEFKVDKAKAKNIMKQAIAEGRPQLSTKESIGVLSSYGIRVSNIELVHSEDEAVKVANSIGYPIVMKTTFKTISHKNDVGGIILDIKNEEEVRKKYKELMERLKSANLLKGLEGIVVQEMIKGKREMVVGIATDPQYGPMIMFGLGGIFIEAIKDVIFRAVPISNIDANDMLTSVKSYKLLEGTKGTKKANIQQIKEILLRVSQLVSDFEFIDELVINPLLISEKSGEGVAVDGRIKIRMNEAKEILGAKFFN